MKQLIPILLLAISMFGCGAESSDFSMTEAAEDLQMEGGEGNSTPITEASEAKFVSQERKVIKTADYSIKVKNVEKSSEEIVQLIKDHQGYTSSMNMENTSYRITNRMTIRVPMDQFDPLLLALDDLALYTDYRRINSKDVTAEYLDIETRLATKREVRDRYVEILRDQAKTVDEVLNAEEKIRIIQEEIESKEGRLRYLKNQISLSTINLEIYQQVPYNPDRSHRTTFLTKLKKSASDGWSIFTGLIIMIIGIWPLVIIAGLIFWRRRWIKRNLFGHKEKE